MKKYYKTSALFVLLLLLIISCEKDVSTSIPTKPKPVGAKLTISSIPPGAEIYLDGKTSGLVTPDSLTWLDIKKYKVTLKKELYRDTSFQVNVVEDSSKTIMIDFNSNPKMWGSITCNSWPLKSKIFLNGKFTGKVTPSVIDSLIPGKYKIKYSAKNYRSDSLFTTVMSSEKAIAFLLLVDTTYWVDYNTNTSGIFDEAYKKIAINKNNIIWLGSVQNGLTRFDGKTWTKYTSENSDLISNNINEIKFGPNDHLWVCTLSGLNEFDGINWKLYQSMDSTGFPNDIAFESDGTPIVATTNGLARYKNDKWEVYRFNLNLPSSARSKQNYFTGIDIDNLGDWWATRLQNGIAHWDGESWQQFFTSYDEDKEGSDPNIYYKIVRYSDNKIWFGHFIRSLNGAFVGLSSYSNGQFDKSSYSNFTGVVINSIKIKNGNEKWISSSKGLFRFVNFANRTRYRQGNTSLVTNNIQDVAFDSKGDAWVVTLNNGIYHFKINN